MYGASCEPGREKETDKYILRSFVYQTLLSYAQARLIYPEVLIITGAAGRWMTGLRQKKGLFCSKFASRW